MDTSHVSFCPYRISINTQWTDVQITEHAEPLAFSRKPHFTKYTAPVTFTGTVNDLEHLDARKQGPDLAGDSAKYLDVDPDPSNDGNAAEGGGGVQNENSENLEVPVLSVSNSPVQHNNGEEDLVEIEQSKPPSDASISQPVEFVAPGPEEIPAGTLDAEAQENTSRPPLTPKSLKEAISQNDVSVSTPSTKIVGSLSANPDTAKPGIAEDEFSPHSPTLVHFADGTAPPADEDSSTVDRPVSSLKLRDKSKKVLKKERLLKEKAARDEVSREKAEAAKEKAIKDKAAREQAALDKATKDKEIKEKAAIEKAAREQAHQEKVAKEKAAREQVLQEKAAKDKAAKEKAALDKAAKDQAIKEKFAKDKLAKEQAAKEKAAKAAEERAAKLEKDLSSEKSDDLEKLEKLEKTDKFSKKDKKKDKKDNPKGKNKSGKSRASVSVAKAPTSASGLSESESETLPQAVETASEPQLPPLLPVENLPSLTTDAPINVDSDDKQDSEQTSEEPKHDMPAQDGHTEVESTIRPEPDLGARLDPAVETKPVIYDTPPKVDETVPETQTDEEPILQSAVTLASALPPTVEGPFETEDEVLNVGTDHPEQSNNQINNDPAPTLADHLEPETLPATRIEIDQEEAPPEIDDLLPTLQDDSKPDLEVSENTISSTVPKITEPLHDPEHPSATLEDEPKTESDNHLQILISEEQNTVVEPHSDSDHVKETTSISTDHINEPMQEVPVDNVVVPEGEVHDTLAPNEHIIEKEISTDTSAKLSTDALPTEDLQSKPGSAGGLESDIGIMQLSEIPPVDSEIPSDAPPDTQPNESSTEQILENIEDLSHTNAEPGLLDVPVDVNSGEGSIESSESHVCKEQFDISSNGSELNPGISSIDSMLADNREVAGIETSGGTQQTEEGQISSPAPSILLSQEESTDCISVEPATQPMELFIPTISETVEDIKNDSAIQALPNMPQPELDSGSFDSNENNSAPTSKTCRSTDVTKSLKEECDHLVPEANIKADTVNLEQSEPSTLNAVSSEADNIAHSVEPLVNNDTIVNLELEATTIQVVQEEREQLPVSGENIAEEGVVTSNPVEIQEFKEEDLAHLTSGASTDPSESVERVVGKPAGVSQDTISEDGVELPIDANLIVIKDTTIECTTPLEVDHVPEPTEVVAISGCSPNVEGSQNAERQPESNPSNESNAIVQEDIPAPIANEATAIKDQVDNEPAEYLFNECAEETPITVGDSFAATDQPSDDGNSSETQEKYNMEVPKEFAGEAVAIDEVPSNNVEELSEVDPRSENSTSLAEPEQVQGDSDNTNEVDLVPNSATIELVPTAEEVVSGAEDNSYDIVNDLHVAASVAPVIEENAVGTVALCNPVESKQVDLLSECPLRTPEGSNSHEISEIEPAAIDTDHIIVEENKSADSVEEDVPEVNSHFNNIESESRSLVGTGELMNCDSKSSDEVLPVIERDGVNSDLAAQEIHQIEIVHTSEATGVENPLHIEQALEVDVVNEAEIGNIQGSQTEPAIYSKLAVDKTAHQLEPDSIIEEPQGIQMSQSGTAIDSHNTMVEVKSLLSTGVASDSLEVVDDSHPIADKAIAAGVGVIAGHLFGEIMLGDQGQPPLITDQEVVAEPEQISLKHVPEETVLLDKSSPKTDKRSNKHRSSRHSTTHSKLYSVSKEIPADESHRPHSQRKRRESESSFKELKGIFSSNPPTKPSRHDSGFSVGSASSNTKKHRTQEEQALHDKKKEERRAAKARDSKSAVFDKSAADPPVPNRVSSHRHNNSRHSHGSKEEIEKRPMSGDMKKLESIVKHAALMGDEPQVKEVVKKQNKSSSTEQRAHFALDPESPKSSQRKHSSRHQSSSDRKETDKERYRSEEEKEARRARKEIEKQKEVARVEFSEESRRQREKDEDSRRLRREERRKKREAEEKGAESSMTLQNRTSEDRPHHGHRKSNSKSKDKEKGPLKSVWSFLKKEFA